MPRPVRVAVFALVAVTIFVAARRRPVAAPSQMPLDLRRSFAVTDRTILEGLPFSRVLDTLTAKSGTATTSETLFRQWMDTQNRKPGLDATTPHCDDELTDGKPTHNGFPRRCPTPEAALARGPYRPDDFIPLGAINRFDLADPNGSHCGQYRLIYGLRGLQTFEFFHIIFEGALKNPNPAAGLGACRPIAQFWADLTAVDSMSERRARLERFFFEGIDGFPPVVHPDHYHRAPAGIRTLQSIGNAGPRFYQFRLTTDCANGPCRLLMKPDVLENLPFGRFFNANVDTPVAQRFRAAFLQNVKDLAVRDVNLYFMNIPNEFLLVESHPLSDEFAFIYDAPFIANKETAAGKAFSDDIAAELRRIGSSLTPEQVIFRAETQNCVGCHFVSGDVGEGVRFPAAASDFQHVTEFTRENGEGGPGSRFAISPAMREVFIPHRMQILRDFLATGKAPVHSNATVGGERTIH